MPVDPAGVAPTRQPDACAVIACSASKRGVAHPKEAMLQL